MSLTPFAFSSSTTLVGTQALPALRLAEEDRHAGLLNQSQGAFIIHAVRELVDELADAPTSPPHPHLPSAETGGASDARTHNGTPTERRRILCIPVRDEADEAAAIMLGELLRRNRFDVQMGATVMQAGELLERVKSHRPDAIIFYNSGVKLCCEGSFLLDDLQTGINDDLAWLVAATSGILLPPAPDPTVGPHVLGQPILIDKFMEDAFEIDVDALADCERVIVGAALITGSGRAAGRLVADRAT